MEGSFPADLRFRPVGIKRLAGSRTRRHAALIWKYNWAQQSALWLLWWIMSRFGWSSLRTSLNNNKFFFSEGEKTNLAVQLCFVLTNKMKEKYEDDAWKSSFPCWKSHKVMQTVYKAFDVNGGVSSFQYSWSPLLSIWLTLRGFPSMLFMAWIELELHGFGRQ